MVGVLLLASAVGAVVRSVRSRHPALVAATAVALLAVVAAGLSGARFVGGGGDASSLSMAVAAAAPDRWEATSPCEGWRARDVLDHVVDGHRSLVAGVRGGEPAPAAPGGDPRSAWEEARRAMEQVAGDPEALAREIDGPVGRMTAGEIVGRFVTMDLLVHTWDLGHGVGMEVRLDEDAVRDAYDDLRPMDEMIRRPGIFGPKVAPPPGADPQTELLSFLGRRA